MCGIAGYNLTVKDARRIDGPRLAGALLRQIQKRGRDATGAAWGDAEGVWYDKAPVPGAQYAATRLQVSPLSRNAILHTRFATGGWKARPAVNENNHPFHFPGVTGIHNGVLWNPDDLWEMAGRAPSVATDSAALFAALSWRDGTRTAVLREVLGDASVAWIETEHPDRTYLARLSGRPLAVGRTPGGSFLWASTKPLLQAAAADARVRLQSLRDVPEWTYLVLEDGRLRRCERLASGHSAVLWAAGRRQEMARQRPVAPVTVSRNGSRTVNPALRLGAV